MTKRHGQEDPASLANRVEAGDVRAVSRLITLLENHEPAGITALKKLRSPSRRSVVMGLGDEVQAMKPGLLEVAHIAVVNKADHPGADATIRDLQECLPRVIRTVAVKGEGVEELVEAIAEHRRSADLAGKV